MLAYTPHHNTLAKHALINSDQVAQTAFVVCDTMLGLLKLSVQFLPTVHLKAN